MFGNEIMLMHALPRDAALCTSIMLLSLKWETPDYIYEVSSLMSMFRISESKVLDSADCS